ncbi:MAG: ATP-dependent sacrificial sulfur transferase LarE [Clostridia bacterium]|nr:ATP-dependent sacrificial sulfur transferase LarE [Clostridia bacterium]
MNNEELLLKKYEKLKEYLASLGSVIVAFSGGVDSTFLLFAAKEALGENAAALTVSSEFVPSREINEAREFCREHGIRAELLTAQPLKNEMIASNPPERCYYCKREIFELITDYASRSGFSAVAEASNTDDNSDYRPGHRAIAELGVKSPLRDNGFSKSEIRALSKRFGLPTWKKPSYACLATRIPYGDRLTPENLSMADRAEQFLIDRGFGQLRVRIHGNNARIELEEAEIPRFMQDEMRRTVYEEFRRIGFTYVSLDISGYRTGSMNDAIGK